MYDGSGSLSSAARPSPRKAHARSGLPTSSPTSKRASRSRAISPARLYVKSTPSSPAAKSMEETKRARSIHRESGIGRRARVLVPIAAWGVAPGADSHLVNESVGRPPALRAPDTPQSPQMAGNVSVRSLPARRAERARWEAADAAAEASSASGGARHARARENASASSPPAMHPWAARRRAPRPHAAARARSFAPEATHSPPPTPAAPASVSVGSTNANARVSHITASSNGRSEASGVRHVEVAAEFGGHSGPSKVRYREHDFFNFLRRRKASSGRHGR